MKDQIIKCQDCGQDFVFTEGEQRFYEDKNLEVPNRCPICRSIFKTAQKDKFRGKVKKDL